MPSRRAWSRSSTISRTCALTEEDIAYLRGKGCFCEDFLDYLRHFPLHRRHLGRAGGHAHLPQGAHPHRPRPGHRGPVHRDLRAADPEPPEPHRHQGQPHRPGGRGPRGDWSSAPAGPRGRTAPSWAPGPPTSAAASAPPAPSPTSSTASPPRGTMAHSWVQMFPDEYDRLQDLLPALSQQRHPAGGHLQRAANPACPTPSGPSRRS